MIAQFSVSVILIIGTLAVNRQTDYILKKDLGYELDHRVIIEKIDDLGNSIGAFRRSIADLPGVKSVTKTRNLVGDAIGDGLYRPLSSATPENTIIRHFRADPDFATTYGTDIFAGQFFSQNTSANRDKVVINRAAAEALGLEESVGEILVNHQGAEVTVIGVMEDFHFETLNHEIKPLMILPTDYDGYGRYLTVLLEPNDISGTLASIKSVWDEYAGGQLFEYEFFDEQFG